MQAMERWAADVSKPLAMMAHAAAQALAEQGETIARIVDKPSIVWVLAKNVNRTQWLACYESPAAY